VSVQRVEFRVRWRREGQARISTRIYQTWSAAYRKAQAIAAIEETKEHTSFVGMKDLVEGPVIEVREVGEWRENEVQPNPPSAYLLERIRDRYAPLSQDDAWKLAF
jgi:hypothetical protein